MPWPVLQSGNPLGSAVRQTRNMPLDERSFTISTSRLPLWAGAAPGRSASMASAAAPLEAADAAVRAAEPVPKSEVEPIVAPVLVMVPLMMACRDQPISQHPPPHEAGKQFPPHVIRHSHNRHDRKHKTQGPYVDRHQE